MEFYPFLTSKDYIHPDILKYLTNLHLLFIWEPQKEKGKEKAVVSCKELSQGSQKANVKCGGTTISSVLWFGK